MEKKRTHKFTEEELSNIKTLYESLDTNHDGKVDKEELIPILKETGVEDFSELCFFIVDENDDDLISFDEFVNFLSIFEENSDDSNKLFKIVFDKLDKDKNGQIDIHELKEFAHLFNLDDSEESLEKYFAEFGKGPTETITLNEVMRSLHL